MPPVGVGAVAVVGMHLQVAAVAALGVAGLLAVQAVMMRRFVQAPVERALWYSGFGVPLFVSGMMVSAAAIGGGQ